VVFSPQIIENFRRSSSDGLSLQFIIVWLAGDVFNILGAVLQGVLPTMIILAIYYTLADIVLLGQCFYYRGFTWKDEIIPPKNNNGNANGHHLGEANERTGLLAPEYGIGRERRWSEVSASHLSPVVPLLDPPKSSSQASARPIKPTTRLQAFIWNLFSIITVCAAGVLGWYLSNRSPNHQSSPDSDDELTFSLWGQIFGYFCALLYLGSRIPQILLNYRRKSTEGVSMLFFLFACIGNLTYVLSIFAYEPHCHGLHGECAPGEAAADYGKYILVNASWLVGSLGTLFLDFGIFVQFFLYSVEEDTEEFSGEGEGESRAVTPRDQRPLLDRVDSELV
jgi:uncharacterized protein with PQ loop repeat